MGDIKMSRQEQLLEKLQQLKADSSLSSTKRSEVLSTLDLMLRTEDGLLFIYENIELIESVGFFKETAWENTEYLQPSLVKGTLCGGFPMVVYESLNQLRIMKIALQQTETPSKLSAENAMKFMEESIISCFDIAFHNAGEETRYQLSEVGLDRIKELFKFILNYIPLNNFKDVLLQEIKEITAQRPLMTDKVEDLLLLIDQNYDLTKKEVDDEELLFYVESLFRPTLLSKSTSDKDEYLQGLASLSDQQINGEANVMVSKLGQTGLVSQYHVLLIRHIIDSRDHALLLNALLLSEHGRVEFNRHKDFVVDLLRHNLTVKNKSMVYGISKFLNRTLLSRRDVMNSLKILIHTKIHPNVGKRLMNAQDPDANTSAKQLIIGGIIRLLGQPLGIGQGMNPTCQSARGLSMWGRHSPGKIIDMLITAVTADELEFRFHAHLINSKQSSHTQTFDFELDPVSIVLVPLLDSIYKQMMQHAQTGFPSQDPHVTVNPAFYGQWIPTGFLSCYNTTFNIIHDYQNFVRKFYSAFNPEHNVGYQLVYPMPLGIFITTSKAKFLGFHAISLLRVDYDSKGVLRAYFFNPNNDGRQNWGQGIKPTVTGNGENHGESSLPFDEFTSRVYAFHFNNVEISHIDLTTIPESSVNKVTQLAQESWGKHYVWG